MPVPELEALKNSALWAAWGDALGFITELTDSSGIRRRIGADRVEAPVAWQRRIGGKSGPRVELPPGCYSDDTQLRLATSRSIGGDGIFDVDAFARVELPVWLDYALGSGKRTRAAALNLASSGATWTTSQFNSSNAGYLNGGGNGAAMRVQPHVWAARDAASPETYLSSVIRNAVCTHGHPRGIVGAALHAALLGACIGHQEVPGPKEWQEAIKLLHRVPDLINRDEDLRSLWLPSWERITARSFSSSVAETINECEALVTRLSEPFGADKAAGYAAAAKSIGAFEPASRGSGTVTTLLAAALAWNFRDRPHEALLMAANLVGSDTDTISTMAGALLGVVAEYPPPTPVLDGPVLLNESARLFAIRTGRNADSFRYPDLFSWELPRAQADFVGRLNDGTTDLALAGLGVLRPVGEPIRSGDTTQFVWQWMQLGSGQHILIKRRPEPPRLPAVLLPGPPRQIRESAQPSRSPRQERLVDIDANASQRPDRGSATASTRSREGRGTTTPQRQRKTTLRAPSLAAPRLNEAVDEALASDLDPFVVGRLLLELARDSGGLDHVVAFAAVVGKAVQARVERSRGSS